MPDLKYFAAFGDVHGEMNAMVEAVCQWEERFCRNIDFVLQVGDFQPHRNVEDLRTMAAPSKYKILGDFHEYHAGKRFFPQRVYFIGGNHEPYGYLGLFPEGSKITTNCYYLGQVGALKRAGIHIVGLSGIYREHEYDRQRPDTTKIHLISNRRFTYFRNVDVDQASAMQAVDVLLLHDWPANIVDAQDAERFRRYGDGDGGYRIGNEPARLLVDVLEPKLVLCGHMHFDYRNALQHESGAVTQVCCLGKLNPEDLPFPEPWANWMAVFRIEADGGISEVTNTG